MNDKTAVEAAANHLFDFSNMPLTVEQDILATLKRIEVLLAPNPFSAPNLPAPSGKLPFSKARGK